MVKMRKKTVRELEGRIAKTKPKAPAKKKAKKKATRGYCIRCGDRKKLEVRRLMCIDCYDIWVQYSKPASTGRYACWKCEVERTLDEFTHMTGPDYCNSCAEEDALIMSSSHTNREWKDKVALYDSCPRCNRKWTDIECPPHLNSVITKDHINPEGGHGWNEIDNLQPMCFSCNSAKGNRIE